jgi:hypothetical protein
MKSFNIKDTFKITDRGHVLSGRLADIALISTGDKILVDTEDKSVVLKIIGINLEKQEGHFGLLISLGDWEKLGDVDLKGIETKIISIKDRQALATQPIIWTGDLEDDCTAIWAGLMLRAELMEENRWWWTVYDMLSDEITIDCSNDYEIEFNDGETSRQKAEEIARWYLNAT